MLFNINQSSSTEAIEQPKLLWYAAINYSNGFENLFAYLFELFIYNRSFDVV